MSSTITRTNIALTRENYDWLREECERRSEHDVQKIIPSKVINELISKARNGSLHNGTNGDEPVPRRRRKPVRLARSA